MAVPTRDQQIVFQTALESALARADGVKLAAQQLRNAIVTGNVGGESFVEFLEGMVEHHAFFGTLPAGLGAYADTVLSNPPADLAGDVVTMRAALQTVIDTVRATLPSNTVSLDAEGVPAWLTFAPGQIAATTLAADLDALIANFE